MNGLRGRSRRAVLGAPHTLNSLYAFDCHPIYGGSFVQLCYAVLEALLRPVFAICTGLPGPVRHRQARSPLDGGRGRWWLKLFEDYDEMITK